jgi:hypothetical protein
MKITYQSKAYAPEHVTKRYVRRSSAAGGYDWCEVGPDRRYDIRQGTVEPGELPDAIRAAADEHYKASCSYIDWPYSNSQ